MHELFGPHSPRPLQTADLSSSSSVSVHPMSATRSSRVTIFSVYLLSFKFFYVDEICCCMLVCGWKAIVDIKEHGLLTSRPETESLIIIPDNATIITTINLESL